MRFRALYRLFSVLVLVATVSAASGAPHSAEAYPDSKNFQPRESYEPSVGAILGAFALNLVYVPVRFAITVVGAGLGGLEGLMSAGDKEAAAQIWKLTDGSQVITPAMLEGRQPWTFSGYGW
jgi:hypothetical protein